MRFIFCCILLLLCGIAPARAASDFAYLPVLHDGRVKPIESFARIHLKLFSGQEKIDGLSANQWLQETLFNPGAAFARPVFKITHPEVLQILGLEKRLGGFYALSDIAAPLEARADLVNSLMEQDRNTLTQAQVALLDLAINKILFSHILRGLALVMPVPIDPPQSLGIENKDEFTALDFKRIAQTAADTMDKVLQQKGMDIDRYTDEEKQLAQFMMQMSMLEEAANNSALFRIIPVEWEGSRNWLSPSLLVQTGQGSPESAAYLNGWKQAAIAYREGDKKKLKNIFGDLRQKSEEMLPDTTSPARLKLEVFSRTVKPFHKALFFFASSILLCAIYTARKNTALYKSIWVTAIFGFLLTALGVALRVVILARPPVATLYESALFVAAIAALLSFYVEYKQKNALGLFSGSVIAAFLIAISGTLAINPDDKEVLSAVLDTNFWLGTHVLSITAGYGACLITALLAHLYLGLNAFGKDTPKKLFNLIQVFALVSLMLTTVGTILGGVWADQSWGRFWGWDPKENGALLIVLWIIWTLHGRISGHLSKPDIMALHALLTVIVALAWFGVNLLNVGLHSYGFISGIFYGLSGFIAAELLLIGGLYFLNKKREAAHA